MLLKTRGEMGSSRESALAIVESAGNTLMENMENMERA